jgi:hypothetical protein
MQTIDTTEKCKSLFQCRLMSPLLRGVNSLLQCRLVTICGLTTIMQTIDTTEKCQKSVSMQTSDYMQTNNYYADY